MPKSAFKDHFYQRTKWADLDPDYIRSCVELAKSEDLYGRGWAQNDSEWLKEAHPSSSRRGEAALVARSSCVLCGSEIIPVILDAYEPKCSFEPKLNDGTYLAANETLGVLAGPAEALLSAERVILNFLQHLSGIASITHDYVEAMESTTTCLLDTRKTTPGLRALEKYAVACGGGWNHRKGLFDRIMLKDNHWASENLGDAGMLKKRIDQLKQAHPTIPIEVEVDHLAQVDLVLGTQADAILLDNFSPEEIRAALSLLKGALYTEASGNINRDTLADYAHLGLDFISTGAITHQSVWVDIGMDWL